MGTTEPQWDGKSQEEGPGGKEGTWMWRGEGPLGWADEEALGRLCRTGTPAAQVAMTMLQGQVARSQQTGGCGQRRPLPICHQRVWLQTVAA